MTLQTWNRRFKHYVAITAVCGVTRASGRKLLVAMGRHNFVEADAMHRLISTCKVMRIFAHNGARYDSFLLLEDLRNYCGIVSRILYNNGRLLQFCVKEYEITVTDSMLFIPIALSHFNATFGLGGRAIKGFFTHLL